LATLIQIRRDTQANWINNNPILASGEIAFSTDQYKIKIGDGTSNWSALSYMTATPTEITNQINAAISGIVDSAPGVLDTLNELAAALNDDPAFFTTVATNLSNHQSDTTNIHGIANTADLATKSYADSAVSTHNSDTTDVHGIADTSVLATDSDLALKADLNSPTFTGYVEFDGIVDFTESVVIGIDALPDQDGESGKYLTTDGVDASWAEIPAGSPHPFSMIG